MKTFRTLYGLDSKGETKYWNIVADAHEEGAKIVTRYGLLSSLEASNKYQQSVVVVRKGKNLGKANETTPYEQACSQAESKWKKKQDEGYTPDQSMLTALANLPKPMLALSAVWPKAAHRMSWPAYVQPKLDGIRMLAHIDVDGVRFTTRKGKPIDTVGHLIPELIKRFSPGDVVDGELFNPDMTLQEIRSGSTRLSERSAKLQFWIYDIVADGTFASRTASLGDILLMAPEPLVWVETQLVQTEERMLSIYDGYVDNGFEGAIVRSVHGEYKRGKRSADLQKVKAGEDDEFEIIGFKDGVGKYEGAVTWRCRTAEGKEFNCNPKGTMEQKRAWFDDGVSFVGKFLTVRYPNLTPDGIPFHPVGIAIRDYEG